MLKKLRERAGMSQSQLAEKSGVSIRMIQHYEQGVKDINKAQGITILKLSKAIGCKMEDLIMEGKNEDNIKQLKYQLAGIKKEGIR